MVEDTEPFVDNEEQEYDLPDYICSDSRLYEFFSLTTEEIFSMMDQS